MLDFAPQAKLVADLLPGAGEDQLAGPTPCEELNVQDMIDHLVGLTIAFRDAANKSAGPGPDAHAEWRAVLPQQLDDLVEAWRAPSAWEGKTEAGGVELPADEMGLVALNELVIHGWDLARATGQPYQPDDTTMAAILDFLRRWENPEGTPGLFGPPVPVPGDAPAIDRAVGLSGRDPSWTPARAG